MVKCRTGDREAPDWIPGRCICSVFYFFQGSSIKGRKQRNTYITFDMIRYFYYFPHNRWLYVTAKIRSKEINSRTNENMHSDSARAKFANKISCFMKKGQKVKKICKSKWLIFINIHWFSSHLIGWAISFISHELSKHIRSTTFRKHGWFLGL